jgi:hypothetical protein
MRSGIINFKLFFLILLMIFSCLLTGISQENTAWSRKLTHLTVGLSLGPSQSQIKNNATLSSKKPLSDKKSSFSGTLDLGFIFSRYIGFNTGIGYGSYSTELSLDSYINTSDLVDDEKEAYQRNVKGTGIKELQNISFLTVPVCIYFQMPFTHRVGIFLQPGVNLSFPLGKNYNSSGTFTYTSYYPAYNVMLKDIPAYGLVTDTKISSNGNLELKTFNVYATVSVGIQYFISSKIQAGLGVNYNRSLSDISNYTSSASFQLSPDKGQINSMMGSGSNISAQSFGLRLSIKYYLR